MKKIGIIGAGPIGLETALAARQRGYQVEVFERGDIAASVRAWGHIHMFSPFAMNASAAGQTLLKTRGISLPSQDALLSGEEFAERYLMPLEASLDVPIHQHTEVGSIARAGALKTEKIGIPQRSETPFRLLVHQNGNERYEEADLVFDCSGTFLKPNPLGDSGQWVPGERGGRKRDHLWSDTREYRAGNSGAGRWRRSFCGNGGA
jgi:threonine dehydrogenase-like Zn-dependent dehydrogenase